MPYIYSMKTNNLTFSKNRYFLIPFLEKILRKETDIERKIVNTMFDIVKVCVAKAPENYKVEIKLKKNQFNLKLPKWRDVNKNHYHIDKLGEKIITNLLYNTFGMIFIRFMITYEEFLSIEERIDLFIKKYNLTQDSYEMLKRRWQRFKNDKKQKKMKKNSKKVVELRA